MPAVTTRTDACRCDPARARSWRSLLPVWRCAAPVPLAGFAGALVDQWHHAGFTVWMNSCAAVAPAPIDALGLQAQLMPAMLAAMAGAMAWQWLRRPAGHDAVTLALCQAGCLVAMFLAAGLCAALAGLPGGDALRLVTMGFVDAVVTLAGATALTAAGRSAGWLPTAVAR